MSNPDTIIDLAATITLLKQILDEKIKELERANKRVEHLQEELERVLREEASHQHDTHTH